MAVSKESLVIEAEIGGSLAGDVKKLTVELKGFGEEARRSFEKSTDASRRFLGVTDAVLGKFRTLGKAAAGMFAADIAAKVFGFSSALDAVRKASDAMAESITKVHSGIRDRLNPSLAAARKEAALAAAEIERVMKLADELRAKSRGDIFTIPGYGRELDTGSGGSVAIPGIDKNLAGLREFTDLMQKALDLIGGAEGAYKGAAERARQLFNQQIATGKGSLSLAQLIRNEVFKEQEAMEGKLAAMLKEAEVRRQILEFERQLAAQGEMQRKQDMAQIEATRQIAENTERAARAAALRAVPGGGSAGIAGGLAVFGAIRAGRSAYFNSPEYQAANDRMIGGSGALGRGVLDVLGRGLEAASAGLRKLQEQLVQTAQAAQTFQGGMRGAVEELRKFVSPQAMGERFTFDSFQNFRGFFNDLADGAGSARDAIRDLARNFVASLADMIAQMLAFRAIASASGFLSFMAPVGAASAGAAPWGGAGTGGGTGSAALMTPPGGGYGGVTLNLSVTSLDPRGAAEVVLSAMPQIQKAFRGALTSGSDRGLVSAVRGA